VILVTVGTTIPFDDLIRETDRLAGEGFFAEPVLFQTGTGTYQPVNGEFFPFRKSLDETIAEASFVIGHGGTGTTLGLMAAGKPFLSVANPAGADNHQAEFLEVLEKKCGIVWTADIGRIAALCDRARAKPYKPLAAPKLANAILAFIESRPA